MRRVSLGAVVALGAIGIGPAAALAHPVLAGAAPTPGLVSPSSPSSVVLSLSEPAAAGGSSVSLTAPSGARVVLGHVHASRDGRTLSAAVPSSLRSAVYAVRWRALGQDGHVVSGSWSFGVAGAGGKAPPGASRLGGAAADVRGSQAAGLEGPMRIGMRWLGIVGAAFLLGGLALRRLVDVWRRFAWRAWVAVVVAALTDALLIDPSLITASDSGKVALTRLLLVAAFTLAMGLARRMRSALLGLGAGGVLITYALEGHALVAGSDPGLAIALQIAHSLSAGVWLGGLLLLALAWRGSREEAGAAARAFAPLAVAALVVSVGTGLPVAAREIGHWYFLRWSDYGRVVIVKAGLVLLVALAGAATWWLARRGRMSGRVLRAEAVLLASVVALAAVLGGLAQGRGQPLPAARGTLLPGPAFATAVLPDGPVELVVAPARSGSNTVALGGDVAARLDSARVRLSCPGCVGRPSREVSLTRRSAEAPLSAAVDLPSDGAWYATVDRGSPVLVSVGVPRAPGAAPVTVLSVVDLSGPDGERCRTYLLGLELAIGRINAAGGLEGGRKVAPLVLDDGGDDARGAALARDAIGRDHPIAFVPCGGASGSALAAAGGAGVPSLVGDPAVPPVESAHTYRLAADPWADGVALGQYIRRSVQPRSSARVVRVVGGDDASGRRRLAGLQAGLAGSGLRLAPASLAGASRTRVTRLVAPSAAAAVVVDTPQPASAAAALRRLGAGRVRVAVAPVLGSERVLSESFVRAAGGIGRLGAVQGTSSVGTQSRDAIAYAGTVGVLYQGERPTLEGLRGYATGLALIDGVHDGTGADQIAHRLTRPAPFTDALVAPWRSDAPAAGSPRLAVVGPTFLPATLIPASTGGETYSGRYFADGAWRPLGSELYGPSLRAPVPPLR